MPPHGSKTVDSDAYAGTTGVTGITQLDEVHSAPGLAASRRVAVSVALASIVGVATATHAALASRIESPSIIPDELIYSELAKSLAEGGLPRVRGSLSFAYGLGYPAVLAPLWAVFEDVRTAYAAAKVVNALVLSSTAVPAYFLARRFVSRSLALLVAALTVSVPSMLYAGTLLTEVALYPTFVLALLGIALALERPTRWTQAVALGAIALAASVKMLAIVLLVAYVAAILLFQWLDVRRGTEWRARLRLYAPTWIVVALGAVLGIGASVAAGRSPADVLGAYATVARNIDFLAVPWWFVLHVAELDLYIAVIPFIATLLVLCRGVQASSDRRERLFLALSMPVITTIVLAVAAYSSKPLAGAPGYFPSDARIHERSTFILAPLLFVGLALWLRDRRAWATLVVGAAGMAALLPSLIPVGDLDGNVRFQALALVPWVLHAGTDTWRIWGLALPLSLAAFFWLATRFQASNAVFVVPVLLVFVGVGIVAHAEMRDASANARSATAARVPNWIDATVGPGSEVAVLWAEPGGGPPAVRLRRRHYVVFVGEFFNRSIGRVFELGSPMPYALPTTRASLAQGRVLLPDGSPAPLGKLVLAPCWVDVEGVPVVRDPATGATVYRAPQNAHVSVSAPETCS